MIVDMPEHKKEMNPNTFHPDQLQESAPLSHASHAIHPLQRVNQIVTRKDGCKTDTGVTDCKFGLSKKYQPFSTLIHMRHCFLLLFTLFSHPHHLVKEGGLDNDGGDSVGVNVGSRSAIFQVAVALLSNVTGDSNRSTSVGNTGGKGGHAGSLVLTGKTLVVVLSVNGNVFQVLLLELLDRILDGGHTLARCSRSLGGEVGVASGTVPVALEGLGVERGLDSPLFSDTEEQEPGHPKVVSHLDTLARSDLELPLGRHDLGVDTRDGDTGVKTSSLGISYILSTDNYALT
jgi:hypothetical protein